MKRTFLMLAIVGAALTACDKNDEPYQFKGTAEQIYLNGKELPKFKSTTTQYSVAEIVINPYTAMLFRFELAGTESVFCKHFGQEFHDTVNNRLLMQSSDILTEDGRLVYDFIGASDVYFAIVDYTQGGDNMNINGDTVAYIPQSVINSAREQIEALYAQERYDEIYELFHTAFTFYPCTGQEYKDIVANAGN